MKIHYGTLKPDGKGNLYHAAACGAKNVPYGKLWSLFSSAVQGSEKINCKNCIKYMNSPKNQCESPL